ncbi:AfsR/SARP family transcriptional regulator [Streptomyces macrosporus]|uniref:AfsR/SARP family transcriptional regulator n=1 Tax=Streptomyces macrosporus TaxID=44032 RepID=A0ABP5WLR0_9ACTN
MRFNVMGSFEIIDDHGKVHSPGMPKVCQTLAVLLTRPGEVAGIDSLILELWGDSPPRTATTTLQTYIYYARKMFVTEGLVPADRNPLVTCPQGYVLQVDADRVDAVVFERLVAEGRAAAENGELEAALGLLRRALALWRGPVLGSVHAGRILKGRIARLEELRIRALELCVDAEIRLGRHREAVAELRELVAEHPLNEWFHGQLVSALYRSGRRAEALQAYQDLRRTLREELGVDPSAEVQRLYHELLAPDRSGRPPADRPVVRSAHRTTVPPPRLPVCTP